MTVIVFFPQRWLLLCFSMCNTSIWKIKMYFLQSFFEFLWSANEFSGFLYQFLVELTQFELTNGKQRVKVLRFTLKVRSACYVTFTPDSYVIKPCKRMKKPVTTTSGSYVRLRYKTYVRITLGSFVGFSLWNFIIKPCKQQPKDTLSLRNDLHNYNDIIT